MCKVALKAPRGTWLSGNKWKHFYISLLVPGTEVRPRLHSSNGIENAHDSQSSRENATPSHCTAPLAYYQEDCVDFVSHYEEFYQSSPRIEEDTTVPPCKRIGDSLGFCIPRRRFRIPITRFQVLVTGTWIPDSSRYWDSGFFELYCGFRSPGFRISKAQTFGFRVPEAKISGIYIPLNGVKIG